MKKISILTFAKGDNYGAVLQAYALGEVIRKMGHDVQYINYTWTNWKYFLLSKITPLSVRFERFRKVYLRNITKRCYNTAQLAEVVKDSDICIVGSDQVWNPMITTIRAKHYFFDFLPDNIVRFSYAASFGVDKWIWDELVSEIKPLISKFKTVSVREDAGIRICKETFNIECVKVLDPTLLLGDFSRIIKNKTIKNDYVLGFKFAPSKKYYDLLQSLSIELNTSMKLMDVITKNISLKAFKLNPIFFPSPEKWVESIANAKFVVTDSFHCMAFSIIFQKDFLILSTSATNHLLDGRMKSLLLELGLEDRIFYSVEDIIASQIWNSSIDYTLVNRKLTQLRKESLSFLKKGLEF